MARKLTTAEFIEKAKAVHGDRYDYSLSKYFRSCYKVKIICRKHGVFEQRPNAHYTGQNCPHCAAKVVDFDSYVTEATRLHSGKSTYPKADEVNFSLPLKFKCPLHGTFLVGAKAHLEGEACDKCSIY